MDTKQPHPERKFPLYPHVRQAYGKDISGQEYCLLTGASDFERPGILTGIIAGDWSNNWLPMDNEPRESN